MSNVFKRQRPSGINVLVFSLAFLSAVSLVLMAERPASGYVPFSNLEKIPFKWNLTTQPGGAVPWQLEPGAPDSLRQAMLYATATWSDATHGALKFTEGPGGIIAGWDADGTRVIDSGYLAYTTFNVFSGTSDIAFSRIVVNAHDYHWSDGTPGSGRTDLNGVILHEMGHSLGLDHSDKNASAIVGLVGYNNYPTMNSTVFPGIDSLHTDDAAGAQSLYGYLASNQSGYEVGAFTIAAKRARGGGVRYTFTQTGGGDDGTLWDFGDGEMATGQEVEHRYKRRGTFTVTALWNGRTAVVTVKGMPGKVRPKDLLP